jgi:hypothetical protein
MTIKLAAGARTRLDWPPIIEQAATIVNSYSTGVTLRQLFYRLVAAQVIPNKTTTYQLLSSYTAAARRDGTFPALIERGRQIYRPYFEYSVIESLDRTVAGYRLDRTRGQEQSVYIVIEKAGLETRPRNGHSERHRLPHDADADGGRDLRRAVA